jgi:hypothetical protein
MIEEQASIAVPMLAAGAPPSFVLSIAFADRWRAKRSSAATIKLASLASH